MKITVNGKDLHFATPDARARWRVETLYTKEPDTIAWIERFEPNSVFWDVGANIGIYSLYAAAFGHEVYAFEPDAGLFAALTSGVDNSLARVLAFPSRVGSDADLAWFNERSLCAAPRYLKIDTDGDDYAIIQGLGDLHPKQIQIETDLRNFEDAKGIATFLSARGYRQLRRSVCPFTPDSPIGNELWSLE